MSTDSPISIGHTDMESEYPRDAEKQPTTEPEIDAMSEVLLDIDPVMSRKMHLVNNVSHSRAN
jgi:hypothetical protein